ncbi:MAG: hypothetical protein DHS20C06_05250 [Hyphobacterium sp.]|nr:MAG: hypothetical protein DHS20C06_05250 [Hyphobacterium sp.]
MMKYVLIFGGIGGAIVGGAMLISFAVLAAQGSAGSQMFGYLTMLVGLSMVFVAIKRYRDDEKGGVIKFWPALWLGIQVSLVAGLIYVVAWEIYYAMNGEEWMATYLAEQTEAREAGGASQDEIDDFVAQSRSMADLYSNWWFRMPLTLSEILPVGLLVSLISAGILRNPKILPKRAVG